jgi:hypothetical protein
MDEAWQAGAPAAASDPNVLLGEAKGVSDSPICFDGRLDDVVDFLTYE